jgi:hypothetical protein
MLVTEIFEPHSPIDADLVVEMVETQMMVELFGGLRGVASGGFNKLKQAGQAMKGMYNDGEVKALLNQLTAYKDKLKSVIQSNPHAFTPQASPQVMNAKPAVDPARAQYQQERREARGNRPEQERPLSSLTAAEKQAGTPRPARRRMPSMKNAGMTPNADAVPQRQPNEMPQQSPTRKPHIKLRSPRPHMEGEEMYGEIVNELFGGLSGVAAGGFNKAKQVARSIGGDYAKGEAQAIIKKMMGIVAALKERGYQLPPELAQEVQRLQQSAA